MIKVWIQAARPKTLIASISPVLIGTILSITDHAFHSLTFLCTLLSAICIQVGTNLVNDCFDFLKGADKQRKGPLRVTQAGLISVADVKRGAFFVFALAAFLGIYLIFQGGFIIAFLIAISILFGIIYTAGPYPLAYLGLGDLFVLLFFGPIAVAGTYYLQTGQLTQEALIAGLSPGALSAAILVINNLRDIDEDARVRKKTLPVRFGKRFGKWEYLFAMGIAALAPLLLFKKHPFCLLSLVFVYFAVPLVREVFKNDDPHAFVPLFQKTPKLLIIYTLLFCIGWMI